MHKRIFRRFLGRVRYNENIRNGGNETYKWLFTMNFSDGKNMSDFKVGIIGIPAESRREHDLEIRSAIKQRVQL
jgi:hypothetical protein